jgi:SAM-dependent methyltransferase
MDNEAITAAILAAERPILYAPSEFSIWTDPWIQGQLLKAHLDDATDAASRAPAQRARALAWLEGWLPPAGGRVADLGCGPGLYAESLARAGREVVGIDLSAASLGYARASAAAQGLRIDYRQGDYLDCELGSGYDLAMMIYCDFGALAPDEALIILDRAREALKSGGILAFDVLGPGYAEAIKPRREWRASAGPGFWSPRPCLALEESFVYPGERCSANQCLVLVPGEESRLYRTWDRWFGEDELVALVESRGFEAVEIRRGLVSENDFGSSEVLFVAARKRG